MNRISNRINIDLEYKFIGSNIHTEPPRIQIRESSIVGPLNRHFESSIGPPGRVATQNKLTEQRPLQFPAQSVTRISNQQLVQLCSIGNHASSPTDFVPPSSSDIGQSDLHSGVTKQKSHLLEKQGLIIKR